MKAVFDAFWRAALYCLHPRVIALSVLPLILMVGLAFGLGYLYWDTALELVRHQLEDWAIVGTLMGWLDSVGWGGFRHALAPLAVVLAVTPVIVVVCILTVAALMTPAMVSLVSERRFHAMERKRGGSTIGGLFATALVTLVALVVLAVQMPLWLIPPLLLVLPPLTWGWMTYRIMSYDVLAEHASAAERRELVKRHRAPLLTMGIISGYLGAAPSLIWASGAMMVALAPFLVPVAIWIYTLVFAFSALWFAHFALDALNRLRLESLGASIPPAAPAPEVPLVPAAPEAPPALPSTGVQESAP